MDKAISPNDVDGTITPPPSKSYAQRALAASLLSNGESTIKNLELCDDTRAAMRTIERLGAIVTPIDDSTIRVIGGFAPRTSTIEVGESGLSTRLFTPIASLSAEPITIQGEGSLLKRSMSMMIEPLCSAGVEVEHNNGYLPFTVCGPIKGGEIRVDGSISSQFITGLLLALPLAEQDTTLYVDGAVSLPYIDMTIETARSFGVEIHHNDYTEFFIEGSQSYTPTTYEIEGDWSSASTLLVAGAIAGSVEVKNLSMLSKQADRTICDALIAAGAQVESHLGGVLVTRSELRAFSFDATQSPDLFPALVALAAACEGTSHIKGAERLIHKESNRALTLQSEYRKLGIDIEIEGDEMIVHGGTIHAATVESHADHRIAMSLAVAALIADGEVTIQGAESVSKSYPTFFEDLESIRK